MRDVEKKNEAQRIYREDKYQDPEWRKMTNARAREYHSRYMKNPETFIKRKLNRVKESAKRRGLEFSLTKEDIILPQVCPILGIKLIIGEGRCDGTPALDRIDNSVGYIPGNVRIISNKANRCKADLTIQDLEQMVRYMKREI